MEAGPYTSCRLVPSISGSFSFDFAGPQIMTQAELTAWPQELETAFRDAGRKKPVQRLIQELTIVTDFDGIAAPLHALDQAHEACLIA